MNRQGLTKNRYSVYCAILHLSHIFIQISIFLNFCMFDWLGKNGDKSGKSQGILISCMSGNPEQYRGLQSIRLIGYASLYMLLREIVIDVRG